MNEAGWRVTRHAHDLIRWIERQEGNHRRRRLFGCACCRRVWDLLCRGAARRIVELAEAHADGEVSEAELRAASDHPDFADLQRQLGGEVDASVQLSLRTLYALSSAMDLAMPVVGMRGLVTFTSREPAGDYLPTRQRNEVTGGGYIAEDEAELAEKVKLLREIFGNPFRPVVLPPEWRTSTAVALATRMYEARDFSAMPILADALQDAGCDSAEVLAHCRGAGPHVRGCWAVDLVLGKE